MEQTRPRRHAALRECIGYAVLLCCALVLFCTLLSLNLRRVYTADLDRTLLDAAAAVRESVEIVDGQLRFSAGDPAPASQPEAALLSGRLVALDGAVQDGFGPYRALPAAAPAGPGSATLRAGSASWRVQTSAVVSEAGQQIGWMQVAASLAPIERLIRALGQQLMLGLPLTFLGTAGAVLLVQRQTRRHSRAAAPAFTPDEPAPDDAAPRRDVPALRLADALDVLFAPIAALRGTLAGVNGKRATKRSYEEALRAAQDQAAQLAALHAELAQLDQATARPAEPPTANDLATLITNAAAALQPLLAARALQIAHQLPEAPMIVGVQAELERLCRDVLAMAADAAAPGSALLVAGSAEHERYVVRVGPRPAADSAAPALAAGALWPQLAGVEAQARRLGGSVDVRPVPGGLEIALALVVEPTTAELEIAVGG